MERAVLFACACFILLLLALTVYTAVADGPSPLTVMSAVVLVLLSIGVIGALRGPPG